MSRDASFGRVVKLRVYATTIGDSGSPNISYNSGYTEFDSVMPDGTDGFRIKGKVSQVQPTVGWNTIQSSISIYNLGPDSRNLIQSKVGTKIEIYAGYGDNVKQIGVGNILLARTHKEGSDYITEITAGDGHFALTNGLINMSFKGATTAKQVIDAILNALEDVQIFRGVIDYPTGTYNNGIVLSRSPLDDLSAVCTKFGRTLTIRGGAAFILPIGQDIGNPIILISENTGLIGIPELKPPGINGIPPTGVPVTPDNDISFTSLMNAELIVGQKVQIQSKFVNGEYTIGTSIYDFDSWSGPFYTECEAFKALPGSTSG